jgi:signal peptidase I
VLGDHRSVSKDSRSLDVGLIPVDSIVGKVVLRVAPFEKFGLLD